MTMTTEKKLAVANLKDLVSVLMLSSKAFDMSTIQHCAEVEMIETGLKFKPYFAVLAENTEGYYQTQFDTTEDYFYDAINIMNITEGKIGLLIDLCIA